MKQFVVSIVCVAAILVAGSVASAQGKGGGPKAKPHGPTIKSTHTTASSRPSRPETRAPRDHTRTATTKKSTITTTGTLTPVQMKLQRNANLANKLRSRLPKGTDLMIASEGFKNLGQFVAAVNVSHNLGIDFAKLKIAMVNERMSLGQAIQSQRSTLDAAAEASRAQREADLLIRSSETETKKHSASQPKKASNGVRTLRSEAQ